VEWLPKRRERGERIDTGSLRQLAGAFATVFFVLGLGFAVQRLRPLAEQTLDQMSGLVVKVVLPIFTFYVTATNTTPETLAIAPALVWMGVLVAFLNFGLATLAFKPAGVAAGQQRTFRFASIVPNTAFLGFPICLTLFGPLGLFYAVVHDFGSMLISLTFGIWDLSGGRTPNPANGEGDYRPANSEKDYGPANSMRDYRPAHSLRDLRLHSLVLNPLIWSVVAGAAWATLELPMPDWGRAPIKALGDATLPMALLVAGAILGTPGSQVSNWRRQLAGLAALRLIVSPLIVAIAITALGWHVVMGKVIIMQAAMPAGLSISIMAKTYGSDARFGASATLWSTVASLVTLPAAALLIVNWF
jgi:predicted permease